MHYVTNFRDRLGDTHQSIDIGKLTTTKFPVQKDLTKDDIVIILGDAGFVWSGREDDKYWQKWISEKNFTTFCVVGNHENYDLINNYPIVNFCGGKARKITDSLYYEIRGEVYTFDRKTFLSCGGAESTDKELRKEGTSWWPQEQITEAEINNALENLAAHNFQVDYIISHTGGSEVCRQLGFAPTISDEWLDKILETAKSDKHYLGHYHLDKLIDKSRILYDDIIEI